MERLVVNPNSKYYLSLWHTKVKQMLVTSIYTHDFIVVVFVATWK